MGSVRSAFKWGVFLSSYVPLFFILAVKHFSFRMRIPSSAPVLSDLPIPVLSIFWILLSVASLVALYFVINIRLSKEPEPHKVEEIDNKNDAITSYILVYIFPFVVLDLSQVINWISFIVFFVVIGIIQVRSNHLYVNPILGIIGYDIYEVETDRGRLTLLSNKDISHQTETVPAIEISNGVFITK